MLKRCGTELASARGAPRARARCAESGVVQSSWVALILEMVVVLVLSVDMCSVLQASKNQAIASSGMFATCGHP